MAIQPARQLSQTTPFQALNLLSQGLVVNADQLLYRGQQLDKSFSHESIALRRMYISGKKAKGRILPVFNPLAEQLLVTAVWLGKLY